MTLDDDAPSSTADALADNDPTETVIVALPPPEKPPHHDRDGRISQTTEHLLIAAGSIGMRSLRYSVGRFTDMDKVPLSS